MPRRFQIPERVLQRISEPRQPQPVAQSNVASRTTVNWTDAGSVEDWFDGELKPHPKFPDTRPALMYVTGEWKFQKCIRMPLCTVRVTQYRLSLTPADADELPQFRMVFGADSVEATNTNQWIYKGMWLHNPDSHVLQPTTFDPALHDGRDMLVDVVPAYRSERSPGTGDLNPPVFHVHSLVMPTTERLTMMQSDADTPRTRPRRRPRDEYEHMCVICQSGMATTGKDAEDVAMLTKCQHMFHLSCIQGCLDSRSRACPMCRTCFVTSGNINKPDWVVLNARTLAMCANMAAASQQ